MRNRATEKSLAHAVCGETAGGLNVAVMDRFVRMMKDIAALFVGDSNAVGSLALQCWNGWCGNEVAVAVTL